MAARIRALVVSAAAVATISGTPGESIQAAPAPPSPVVPEAALLPPETVPHASARDGFDVASALSTPGRGQSRVDIGGCEDVVHGRLVGDGAAGQGFQSAVPGGQVSELVARLTNPPDLPAWAAQAGRCSKVTVDDAAGTAVSTVTVHPGPAVPGAKTLSYEQLLTLPGQPPSCRDCVCAPSPSPPTTCWSCFVTPGRPASISTRSPSPPGGTPPVRSAADPPHHPGY
ncbi:hypothetical protein [Amycolatopsis sp. EV170708-02-1]|uniref:hypothetical protein n=1 Tax=Amycolatopsis sp. EV170708-02-1 TaxID=2919322 RepID=UPI001F0B91CB|nr:hypothetical protein [Amycolatopsis sp. EV170708-02-1]UMO99324.1 hypothetical protein MJQ72_22415 [Amycolatopsis sp. EV170708-02-1]